MVHGKPGERHFHIYWLHNHPRNSQLKIKRLKIGGNSMPEFDVEEDCPECLLEINEPNWGIVDMPNSILLSQLQKISSSNHFWCLHLIWIPQLMKNWSKTPGKGSSGHQDLLCSFYAGIGEEKIGCFSCRVGKAGNLSF